MLYYWSCVEVVFITLILFLFLLLTMPVCARANVAFPPAWKLLYLQLNCISNTHGVFIERDK